MHEMPEQVLLSFIEAFARLDQRVIWQWKGERRDDLPQNVQTVQWLPQQDLLGHKNCRLLMTHGGISGLQEAVYHGVPVLGLPLGSDHILNLGKAVSLGYASTLYWNNITADTLSHSLRLLLDDPS